MGYINTEDETDQSSKSSSVIKENGVANHAEYNSTKTTPSTDSQYRASANSSINLHSGEIFTKGPDQIIPTSNIRTWKPDGCVKLRIGDAGPSSRTPISVPSLLKRTAENFPSEKALSVKRNNQWITMNFTEYYETVRTVSKAFISLGLEKFHGVCILGFNSPEWFISNLAAIFAGGFGAGIYTTNSPEACHHCAENCKAQIFVVGDEKQLDKVLRIRDRLPNLKYIIQYFGKSTVEGVLSWTEVLEIGKRVNDDELEKRLKTISINQCCTLIYTSGTTGSPKGVMLSHDNITFTAYTTSEYIKTVPGKEIFVSYLPLSHVAAQMADIYVCITCAACVVFAQPDALKGSLVDTLKEGRPTRFLGVPRVWEKIYEKMMVVGRKNKGLKKCISTWAKSVGAETNRRREVQDFTTPFGYAVANGAVFKAVKRALGLDRCKLFLSGAAPIAPEIIKYFHSLDLCLTEIYGMSESSGPHTICIQNAFKVGSVGKSVPGFSTKILDPDSDGSGEICMVGRNVCMGYLDMEDKTNETIDEKGWLHSGDIGKLDSNGYLFITGRLKELIITAGGENIPPVIIEDVLKEQLPCVSNAMLVGDRRKFLSMLLTLKTDVDSEGEPLDTLSETCLEWCRSVGSKANTVTEVVSGPDEAIMRAIQKGVDAANEKATSNAQRIQKWTVLPKDFTISGDELGPTLKLKRSVVMKKYHDVIERFYK